MEPMGGTAPELLTAAFISMQPPSTVVAYAREVGGGFLTAFSQQFFLDNVFNNEYYMCHLVGWKDLEVKNVLLLSRVQGELSDVHLRYPASQSYVKRVVKAVILAAESDGQEVMDDLYGLHSVFLDSNNGSLQPLAERCYTTLTFRIPESARPNLTDNFGEERASDLIGTKLLTLRISLNLLDGDTGYSVWPAGLYLAQVLLSHPQLVHGSSCLELGSGTGICGIWLSMLAPSKVRKDWQFVVFFGKAVLTDGALSTLVNLRHNLEINGIPISDNKTKPDQEIHHGETMVDCRQLLWETMSEKELLSSEAEVILGADLIYDPTIVPHLIRALAVMLRKRSLLLRQDSRDGRDSDEGIVLKAEDNKVLAPVAYLASALRTLTTLHLFFKLADAAGLEVTDVTDALVPLRILPDIYEFDSSQIRLYKVVHS